MALRLTCQARDDCRKEDRPSISRSPGHPPQLPFLHRTSGLNTTGAHPCRLHRRH